MNLNDILEGIFDTDSQTLNRGVNDFLINALPSGDQFLDAWHAACQEFKIKEILNPDESKQPVIVLTGDGGKFWIGKTLCGRELYYTLQIFYIDKDKIKQIEFEIRSDSKYSSIGRTTFKIRTANPITNMVHNMVNSKHTAKCYSINMSNLKKFDRLLKQIEPNIGW